MQEEKTKDLNQKFDEMMEFLVEHVATKDDIARLDAKIDAKIDGLRDEFKSELTQVRDDLMQEIRAVRHEVDLVKKDLENFQLQQA